MDELVSVVKSFNRLENYIAKYIYKKYIEKDIEKNKNISEEETERESESGSDSESKSESENESDIDKFRYNKTPLNIDEYKLYINKIFNKERKHIISQDETLHKELEDIEIANDNYDTDPKNFKVREFNSLPDIKRCSFIRKFKNKYKRCKSHIHKNNSDPDQDMCIRHENEPNMYWENYCELVDKHNI